MATDVVKMWLTQPESNVFVQELRDSHGKLTEQAHAHLRKGETDEAMHKLGQADGVLLVLNHIHNTRHGG